MSFAAFVSYSHAADGKLAPALQRGLHQIAKPWYRLRTMRVFRDQTNLGANPGLWSSIEAALRETSYFIFLASPTAAQSIWVQKEVDWWCANRPAEKFLIVLTEGEIAWDSAAQDFDWQKCTALPSRLSKIFAEEPLWTDLRWARQSEQLSVRHSQFRGVILDLATTLLNRPKDELDSEDVRQYRRAHRLLWSGVAGLAILLVLAVLAAWIATKQRNIALARALAANAEAVLSTNPELSLLLATAATRFNADEQVEYMLRRALARNPEQIIHHGSPGKTMLANFVHGGSFVIGGERGARASVWRVSDRARVAELGIDLGDEIILSESPTSSLVAIEADNDSFAVFDTSSWKLVKRLPGSQPRFTSDRALIAATRDGKIRRWELPSLEERPVKSGIPEGYTALDMSADGKWLFAVAGEGVGPNDAILLSLDGETTTKFPRRLYFKGAVFTPDGMAILALTADDQSEFELWDPRTGNKARALKGDTGWVERIAFRPDAKQLAVGSRDGVIRVWNLERGESDGELRFHDNDLIRLRYSDDGKLLLSSSADGTAALWDSDAGRRLIEFGGQGDDAWDIHIAPDSRRFITTHIDSTIRLWNRETWFPAVAMPGSHVAQSDRTRSIFFVSGKNDGQMLDVQSGKVRGIGLLNKAPVTASAIDAAGSQIAIATENGMVQVATVNSGTWAAAFSRPGEAITAVAFNPPGDTLAIGTQSGKIFLGNVKPGSNFTDWKVSEAAVMDAIFARNGATLFYSTQNGSVHFIDAKTGREIFKFVADEGGILSRNLALNQDGGLLLVGAGKTAQIWDIAAHRRIQMLTGHSDDVYGGAFSADGRFILTASGFGHARGQAPVDGNAVRVWDAKTGRELLQYRSAGVPVSQVFFGANATAIYSVSWDGQIRGYRCEICAELPALITLAKKRAGRELTADEKARYLPVSFFPWQ